MQFDTFSDLWREDSYWLNTIWVIIISYQMVLTLLKSWCLFRLLSSSSFLLLLDPLCPLLWCSSSSSSSLSLWLLLFCSRLPSFPPEAPSINLAGKIGMLESHYWCFWASLVHIWKRLYSIHSCKMSIVLHGSKPWKHILPQENHVNCNNFGTLIKQKRNKCCWLCQIGLVYTEILHNMYKFSVKRAWFCIIV